MIALVVFLYLFFNTQTVVPFLSLVYQPGAGLVRGFVQVTTHLPCDATALILMSLGLILGLVGVLLSSADIFVRLGLAFVGGLLDVVTFTSCSSLIEAPQLFPSVCLQRQEPPNPWVHGAEVILTGLALATPILISEGL